MKILNVILRIVFGFFILFGLLCYYNVKKTSVWLENRLLEKFEINIILKDSKETNKAEDYIAKVLEKYNNINFIEKKLITKNEVWDMVSEREELKYFSTLISRNPFPDIFKLKIGNFHEQNMLGIFDEFNTNNLIKEVVYDKNIFSYLYRLTNTKKYFVFIDIVILFLGISVIIFSVYKIYKSRQYFILESLVLFFSVIVIGIINYKILKGISIQFNFGLEDVIFYFIATTISLCAMNLYEKD